MKKRILAGVLALCLLAGLPSVAFADGNTEGGQSADYTQRDQQPDGSRNTDNNTNEPGEPDDPDNPQNTDEPEDTPDNSGTPEWDADTVAVIGSEQYKTLEAAVEVVGQNQEGATTIQIVRDTTVTEQINIERKNVILTADEECTITFSDLAETSNCFRVGNWSDSAASLTISGQLTITTTNESLRSIVNVVKSGSLSLQDGTLTSGDANLSKAIICVDNGGSMTMTDGTIEGNQEQNSCGVMLQDTSDPSVPMSFTMTGGMIDRKSVV